MRHVAVDHQKAHWVISIYEILNPFVLMRDLNAVFVLQYQFYVALNHSKYCEKR